MIQSICIHSKNFYSEKYPSYPVSELPIAKVAIADDINKDGDIDFIDLDLIRKANVGNDEYLDIIVDPNAVVTPEV